LKPAFTPEGQSYESKGQLGTIVTLFLVMRLTVLLFYSPQGLFNAYTDYYHYYHTAQLSEQGYLPFINMWYEYPPLLAYLPQLAYVLTRAILPAGDVNSFTFQFFIRLLGAMLLIFDAGVLILLHGIAKRLWGGEKADWLGWAYAGLSLPLFFLTYAHQVVAVFFTLLSVFWFVEQKQGRSAIALGLGVAAKLTPAIFLAPVARFLWPRWKTTLGYALLVILTVALVYLPFVLLGGGAWVLASFQALGKVGSYGTLWAILDGNWGPGNYGELSTRLQLDQASALHANPSLLPGIIPLAIFAVLYALLFFRPVERQDARQFIWFSTLTMMIFHLWSKGWSPQWSVMLLPLVLLSFPDLRGLRLSLGFTALVFAEWPFLTAFESRPLTALFILLRTAFFVYLSIMLVGEMWRKRKSCQRIIGTD
jgi:hypothetical protein